MDAGAAGANRVLLSGVLAEREALRYTPAGIPVIAAKLGHRSEVFEAGHRRQVELEIGVRFAGPIAGRADRLALGTEVELAGFLAPKSRQSRTLLLHVTEIVKPEN